MEASALVRAAGGDPSDEGDIIFHLCEKIREQSQVVADLQKRCAQYEQEGTGHLAQKCRELERKLAELTRPISLSDTLSFPPPNVSLSLSQLVELYSLLYVRMNEVLKEKEELQENLHEEILFSEEQSVILETMREELSSGPQGQHHHSESVQSQEVFDSVAEENPRTEELKAGGEAVAEAYAEIAKLEEEKNALLEYVEQQAMREEHTAAELNRLREEVKSLREENEQFPQSPVMQRNGGSEQAQDDLISLRSAYEKTMLEMEELEEQNQNLQQTIAEAKTPKTQEALESTQRELSSLRVKHQETLAMLEDLQDFRKAEEEADLAVSREEHVSKLEEDNKSLRRLLSDLQEEIESLHSSKCHILPAKPSQDQATSTDNRALEAALVCQSDVETLQVTLSQLISRLSSSS